MSMPASEQGVSRERYMLVPRTMIFLTHGDRVLLLKGGRDKRLWAGLYNGVGGHVEQGEDVLSAARRELAEETGLAPDRLWLCGTITVDTDTNPGVCVFVFRGESAQVELPDSPEGSLRWVKLSVLPDLPMVGDVPVLLLKILGMADGDQAFSAHSRYDENGKLVVTFS